MLWSQVQTWKQLHTLRMWLQSHWVWFYHQHNMPRVPEGLMSTEHWVTGRQTLNQAVDCEVANEPAPASFSPIWELLKVSPPNWVRL